MAVSVSRDALADLFERIDSFVTRFETYIEVPSNLGMVDIITKVMAEVLLILAIATKEIHQNSASELVFGEWAIPFGL